jgi:SAM-dependent methyltransferase
MDGLTERQAREREFYEAYATKWPRAVYHGVISGGARPWNPYWVIHELARAWRTPARDRALDVGCGYGDTAVRLAKLGYRVTAFDISPANIEMARRVSARYDVEDRTEFTVHTAESLPYPDNSFDLIVGLDILHHVDIEATIRECRRVLAPGGRAIFHEPVEAPIFERLRNSVLGRWLVPKTASLERHVTQDERKLTKVELRLIRHLCPDTEIRPFFVLARLDRFLPRPQSLKWSPVERLDGFILRWVPFARVFRGKVVLIFSKPSGA